MTKNQDRMQSHTMELPRLIEIGEKNICDFGRFLISLNKPKKVSLIAGTNVQKVLRKKIERSLKSKKIQFIWHTSNDNQIKSLMFFSPISMSLGNSIVCDCMRS